MFRGRFGSLGFSSYTVVDVPKKGAEADINIVATAEGVQVAPLSCETSINVTVATKQAHRKSSGAETTISIDVQTKYKIPGRQGATTSISTSTVRDGQKITPARLDTTVTSTTNIEATTKRFVSSKTSMNVQSELHAYKNTLGSADATVVVSSEIASRLKLVILQDNPIQYVSEEFINAVNAPTRTWLIEVRVYFHGEDEEPTIFGVDDVVSFDLLEELVTNESNFLGTISANELSLELSNVDRRFTPTNVDSEYHNLLVPGVKVEPFLGLKYTTVDGIREEYVGLGTFWSDDWDADSNAMEVDTTCYDRMYFTGQQYVPGLRVQENITAKQLFELLFESMDIEDYIVEGLDDVEVTGWIPQGKLKDVLQELAQGIAYVDVTRTGKFRVRPLSIIQGTLPPVATLKDTEQITSAKVPVRYKEMYQKINVKQHRVGLGEKQEVLSLEGELEQHGGTEEIEEATFDEDVTAKVDSVQLLSEQELELQDLAIHSWGVDAVIKNNNPEPAEFNLSIIGTPLKVTTRSFKTVNEELTEYSDKELVVDNHLVQTKDTAKQIRDILSKITSNKTNVVDVELRGNPAIAVGNTVLITDPSDKLKDETAILMQRRLSYDGGIEEEWLLYRTVI